MKTAIPRHMRKIKVTLNLHVRKEIKADPAALAEEITDAIQSWGGQRNPANDPFFYGIAVQDLVVAGKRFVMTTPPVIDEFEPRES